MLACSRTRSTLLTVVAVLSLLIPSLVLAADVIELVPGTNVLLSQSGDGGNGGNTSSTTSSTNIFSPATYVDYKRFGGEPTVTVDRYPFTPGQFGATTTEYRDITYASSPNGFAYPHFSPFWKSDDLGQSFRIPCHVTASGQSCVQGGGGGDSHTAVGELTHRLFFVDLPGPGCVTNNISDDLGETFRSDQVGCGSSPGAIDDRQWVEADETAATPNVYISFINVTNIAAPSLSLARSTHDGEIGSFLTDSTCNTLLAQQGNPASIIDVLPTTNPGDDTPTACPDPADKDLQIAGPVVADNEGTATRPPTHNVYIPFVRGTALTPGLTAGPPYSLWVARSTDLGSTWTRTKVAELGDHNPVNLFPQLTVDRGGNLYYTWSQTQGPASDESGLLGEQDVYYTFSTDAGLTWAPPIDLTKETNDSAVMPWMIAGDPGRVDLVYYKANSGTNSNFAFIDSNGNPCEEGTAGCQPNAAVWNVYFAQSINALNTGANFKSVQISDHPNHIGQICTAGLACDGDRDLLDFFTVDIDHLGAANVIWSDDNTTRTTDTRNKFSRQLSGVSVYKNQTINLQNSWPIRDHAVFDRSGDTFDAKGISNGSCPGMDVLGASADRTDDRITISLTLNGLPTSAGAIACGGSVTTGGVWGAEFWAASDGGNAENYYIAYRDNPPDGTPRAEGGRMDNTNATITSLEFHPVTPGTLGGSCFSAPAPTPCTITMTVSASALGIKPGAGLYSITGLSTYYAGTEENPPAFRVDTGNSEQADATAPFDYNGTGATK